MPDGSRSYSIRDLLIATAISFGAIAVIFKYTGASISWSTLSSANPWLVALAFALHIASWLFWAFRLRFLTSLVGHEVGFGLALRATLASNFLAAVTPSSAGGEPLRIKILSDSGISCGRATAIVLGERLLDGVFFIMALAIFLMVSGFSVGFGLEVGGIFLIFMILFVLFLREVLSRPDRVQRVMDLARSKIGNNRVLTFVEKEVWMFREAAIVLAKETKTRIPAMMGMTAAIWLCDFLVPSAILMALGQGPSLIPSITAQLIIVMVSLVPLTPGSSGIVELSMSYLYGGFVPSKVLGMLIGIWRIVTYFFNIFVGAPFAGASLRVRKKN